MPKGQRARPVLIRKGNEAAPPPKTTNTFWDEQYENEWLMDEGTWFEYGGVKNAGIPSVLKRKFGVEAKARTAGRDENDRPIYSLHVRYPGAEQAKQIKAEAIAEYERRKAEREKAEKEQTKPKAKVAGGQNGGTRTAAKR